MSEQEPKQPIEETAEAPETAPETAEVPEENKKKKKKSESTALQAKIDALEQTLKEAQDQYQRMLAEYANYKRRTEQEKTQIGAFTTASVLEKLLVSLDNMERAVSAPDGDNYKAGVDMVMRQFIDELHKMGLVDLGEEGEHFDPEIHNAVMREDADGIEPDTVTQVFQKGYRYGDRVLRPAMVKVAN